MRNIVFKGFLLSGILSLQIFVPLKAQEIDFSFTPETQDLADDQFPVDLYDDENHDRTLRIRDQELIFGEESNMLSGYHQVSFSSDRAFAGVLFLSGGQVSVEIYRSDGSLVRRIGNIAEYESEDPSIRLYMLNDGSFFYRDNIAGFSYFDERGNQVYRASNSTGSSEGETVSEFAATPFGGTVLLYNPQIHRSDRIDSRLQKVDYEGNTRPVASFENTVIENVRIHHKGRVILVHATDEATGNHIGKVLSFRGDLLAEIDYEDTEISELALSSDARFITARASGRVLVHRVASGERIGSASFTESVLTASYMPDGILAVLTGERSSNGKLGELRAHIIDIEQRQVVREETSLTTYTSQYFPLTLTYQEEGTYTLRGTTRAIIIRHTL